MTIKEKKWFAQHFPVGTVVKIEGFKCVTCGDKEEIVTDYTDTYKKFGLVMVVQKVIHVSPTHLMIETSYYNEACGMYQTFNVDHVSSIVKRGQGPVLVDYGNGHQPVFNTKKYISNGPFNKNCYYSSNIREIIHHLVSQSHLSKELSIKEGFIDFFLDQTFVKREVLIPSLPTWKFFCVDKKRAKRFVQQNINRWIKPMKQARKEAEEKAEEEYRSFFDDFEDLVWPEPSKITSYTTTSMVTELDGCDGFPTTHDTGVMSLGEILKRKINGENVFASKE